MDNLAQLGSTSVILVVVICIMQPPVSILVLICIIAYGFVLEMVDRSNRQIKRMANNAMSPLLSNVNEALNGRVLARASSCAMCMHPYHPICFM